MACRAAHGSWPRSADRRICDKLSPATSSRRRLAAIVYSVEISVSGQIFHGQQFFEAPLAGAVAADGISKINPFLRVEFAMMRGYAVLASRFTFDPSLMP